MDFDFEIDYSESEIKKTRRQIKVVRDNYNYQSRFSFVSKNIKFKSVLNPDEITISDLPMKDCCIKFACTKNTITTRLFKLFKIRQIHIMLAVIGDEGFEEIKKHKIIKLVARSDDKELLSPKLNKLRIEVIKKKNHVKLFLIETIDNNKYIITSSSNPKVSDKIECYSIDNSDSYFEYLKNTINSL